MIPYSEADSHEPEKSKNRFSEMLDEIEAARKLTFENVKIAASIEEALIGPCPSKEVREKKIEMPGQIYGAFSRLKEINEVLIELHDILTHIKKESVI